MSPEKTKTRTQRVLAWVSARKYRWVKNVFILFAGIAAVGPLVVIYSVTTGIYTTMAGPANALLWALWVANGAVALIGTVWLTFGTKSNPPIWVWAVTGCAFLLAANISFSAYANMSRATALVYFAGWALSRKNYL